MRLMLARLVTGMIPAITGLSTPRAAQALDQVEVVVGVEEELGDGEVGLGELLGGVAPVGLAARRRPRVRLRDGRRRRPEVADLADEAHELDRVLELAVGEVEVLRRIAAEGEDVVDPGVAVALDDLDQLGARCGTRT